jgi:phenylpropionate dioxygenase-like ring-hydroxylating dioxygenase large terminal subunit
VDGSETGWIRVGRLDEVVQPGTRRAVQLGSESIVVSRDPEGKVRAFFNVCRHRGHELMEVGETQEANEISCPYHGWSYRSDGSLKSAPRLGYRPNFEPREFGLVPVPVETREGQLYVRLD